MKRVIVLGGAGFIGSHLVRLLLATPGIEHITVYDNLSSGRAENIPSDPRLTVFRRDIKYYPHLSEAMAGHDTVFMLAANPDIARAVTEPDIDFREGTQLVQNALEAMRVNGVERIFYFSGSGVYGENAGVEFREDYGPMLPISTYGASKLACEAMICSYCHMLGFTARAFRFANVVGPSQTHGIGYDFIRRLKADPRSLRVLGDGTQSKSYIHVDDALSAVLLVVAGAHSGYDVFNVATGDYITVEAIADLACQIAGADNCELAFAGSDRGWRGDVPVIRFNCDKIKSLGWLCSRNSTTAMTQALRAMKTEICTP